MNGAQSTPSHAVDRLLHTKLMPPRLHPDVIQRSELLARLDEGLTRKLIVLTAPTGFGKSTLAGQWIASRDFRSAWVTLDGNDNDPARFWTYVVSALRTIDSSIGKTTLSMLMASQPTSFQALLTPLVNELVELRETCVLVLEDYHAITSSEINAGVSFLIQHLPHMLHLVLITRTEPDLPLAILRARDELLEIDASSLRFNQRETEVFLKETLKSDISATAVEQLVHKVEGWPAGLRLVVLSLKDKGGAADMDQLVQSFSGGDRYVADYLIGEVFENQPETRQMFLLKTCFFQRLTGFLCDEITGGVDGAAMLEGLDRDNLFTMQLEHTGGQRWYRYNPLFAESVQSLARLRLEEAGIKNIFERASRWYEEHGDYEEAIETALDSKLYERSLILIEKYIEIHELSELHTLSRWLENIPTEEVLRRPLICFTYAQVILYTADRFAPSTVVRLEPFLRAAETAWRSQENHQGLGEVFSFRGNVALWQGDFPHAFEHAHRSLEELPENDALYRGSSLLIISHEGLNTGRIWDAQDTALEARALLGAVQNIYGVLAAVQVLAEVFFWQGELEQAEQLNRQILVEAVGDQSMLDDQGVASLNLARIAYEQNDLEQAGQFASRALDLSGQRGNEMLLTQATIRMAYILAAQNDPARSMEMLKSATAKIQNPVLLREIQEAQARLSILAGDTASLEGWRSVVSDGKQDVLPLQKEREVFTLVRLLMNEGRPEDAVGLLEGRATEAAENGRLRSQVEALCLEALARQALSNTTQATKVLAEALVLGHARGLRRIFLDEGSRMAVLLQASMSVLTDRSLNLYATTLLHSFPPDSIKTKAVAGPAVLVEPLSQQEQRVLRLLVAGLSNAEIARELVVSTNTIKTQVKSIYRKLNVSSRDEAREVARELKLM